MKIGKKTFVITGVAAALVIAVILALFLLRRSGGSDKSGEFDSLSALKEHYREYWREKLLAEGLISDEAGIYTVYFENFDESDEKQLNRYKETDLELKVDVIAIDPACHFRPYRSIVSCRYQDGKLYARRIEDQEFSEIRSRQEALEQPGSFLGWICKEDLDEVDRNERYQADIRSLAQITGDHARENDAACYLALQDPVTATEDFLHLKGGSGEFVREALDFGILTYTFADGSKAHYYMRRTGEIWYPSFLLEDQERAEQEAEIARRIRDRLEGAEAKELRAITERALMGPENEHLYADDAFLLIEDVPEHDAALYGLGMGNGLVLRVRDAVYPVYLIWDIYYAFPDFYADDYDGDGEWEYAIHIMNGRGTGFLTYALYIIDFAGQDMQIREFTYADWSRQLARRISYEYRDGLLEIFDGKNMVFSSKETKGFFEDKKEKFVAPAWGNIMDFVLEDGNWYFDTAVGYFVEGQAEPVYGSNFRMISPVSYKADGTFELGNIVIRIM